ncbi:NF038104 family lipoprotein [Janthinobacterium sp. 17J80-10]|uniref:NF038104 family lipoprotein n=1 Tax=Janthinobacterium sp. 17J80-10 TaxID=2497863 RepID=UPI0013E8F1D3|nr:NF038104 family lipoprotein [Janthinobacterium sp. 17J80-10]
MTTKTLHFLLLLAIATCLNGCAVVAVADAVVTVAATGVKVAAKTVGAVADAVIPDDED